MHNRNMTKATRPLVSSIILLVNCILSICSVQAEMEGKVQASSDSVPLRESSVQKEPLEHGHRDSKGFEPIPQLPAEYVYTTMREYNVGNVSIVVGQAKTKEETRIRAQRGDANARKVNDESDDCSAWISVRKGDVEKCRIVYRTIDTKGSHYGIFVPERQPNKSYFVAVKLGDYDGKLIIVDKKCNVTELVGGRFFVTRDGRYLVSEYVSDVRDVAVFDLVAGKVVSRTGTGASINPRRLESMFSWYYSKSLGYFFTNCDLEHHRGGGEIAELRDHVNVLDVATGIVQEQPSTDDTFKNAEEVKLVFPAEGQPDCGCSAE